MKLYIHHDSGHAYRVNAASEIECAPLVQGNHVLSDEDFGPVEYDLVGDEMITHQGEDMFISDLQDVIRAELAQYGYPRSRTHGR